MNQINLLVTYQSFLLLYGTCYFFQVICIYAGKLIEKHLLRLTQSKILFVRPESGPWWVRLTSFCPIGIHYYSKSLLMGME